MPAARKLKVGRGHFRYFDMDPEELRFEVNVTLGEALHAQLNALAEARCVSRSKLIRDILIAYLKDHDNG
jgi:hypothetical protein